MQRGGSFSERARAIVIAKDFRVTSPLDQIPQALLRFFRVSTCPTCIASQHESQQVLSDPLAPPIRVPAQPRPPPSGELPIVRRSQQADANKCSCPYSQALDRVKAHGVRRIPLWRRTENRPEFSPSTISCEGWRELSARSQKSWRGNRVTSIAGIAGIAGIARAASPPICKLGPTPLFQLADTYTGYFVFGIAPKCY